MKYIILIATLFILQGCSLSISSEDCRKKGYTHGLQNIAGIQIGCSKLDGMIIETYNHARDKTYIAS